MRPGAWSMKMMTIIKCIIIYNLYICKLHLQPPSKAFSVMFCASAQAHWDHKIVLEVPFIARYAVLAVDLSYKE